MTGNVGKAVPVRLNQVVGRKAFFRAANEAAFPAEQVILTS